MPIISIITPTYNSSKYLRITYNSILSQTITDWEWLVTDDFSVDSTKSIINEIAKKDIRVKPLFKQVNSGAAETRNSSISRATGEYIAFLDSDDLWLPEKLNRQIEFMKSGVNFSFTAYEIINENGISLKKYIDKKNKNSSFNYEDMLRKKATLGCSTVMIRKNAFKDLLMPNIRTGQDYALWLKLLKMGGVAYLINKPLTKYRIIPTSISRNKFKKAQRQWEIYRKIEQLNLLNSLECFFWYAIRAIVR